jgi:hypothetical protein
MAFADQAAAPHTFGLYSRNEISWLASCPVARTTVRLHSDALSTVRSAQQIAFIMSIVCTCVGFIVLYVNESSTTDKKLWPVYISLLLTFVRATCIAVSIHFVAPASETDSLIDAAACSDPFTNRKVFGGMLPEVRMFDIAALAADIFALLLIAIVETGVWQSMTERGEDEEGGIDSCCSGTCLWPPSCLRRRQYKSINNSCADPNYYHRPATNPAAVSNFVTTNSGDAVVVDF